MYSFWKPGAVVAAALLALNGTSAVAGPTVLVSTGVGDAEADEASREPALSADGRFVVFESRASNLVPDDTNGVFDVFVRDLVTGELRRVSVGEEGQEANDVSEYSMISADGTTVAFMSRASNLVADDTNDDWDYFVYELATGRIQRVSVSDAGRQGNGGADCECMVARFPGVSEDGRFIAFVSTADDLVEGDTNGAMDVFVRDRLLERTTRVSLDSFGREGDDDSYVRDLTPDGRYIAMYSYATNLVPDDTNGHRDIFVRDLWSGITRRVSVAGSGEQADHDSDTPKLSADGRFVAFASFASNLIPDDSNGRWDVFVHDLLTGETELVSQSTAGEQGNSASRHPSITADGRYVVFHSFSNNLVDGDTNGERDVFLRDRWLGITTRVSVGPGGVEGDRDSCDGFISADGSRITYDSVAGTLVRDDANRERDVFVHELEP